MIGRTFRYGAVWRGLGLFCAGLGVGFPLLMYANNEKFTATSFAMAAAFVIVGAYGYAYGRAYRLEFRPDGFAVHRLARETCVIRWNEVQSARTDARGVKFLTTDRREITVSIDFAGYHALIEEASRNLPRARFAAGNVPVARPEALTLEEQRDLATLDRDTWRTVGLRAFMCGLALVAGGEAADYVSAHRNPRMLRFIIEPLSEYGARVGFGLISISILFAIMCLQAVARLRKLPPE